MLILQRRDGERVTLETSDGVIELVVERRSANSWELVIDAPKCVAIHRDDAQTKRHREQEG